LFGGGAKKGLNIKSMFQSRVKKAMIRHRFNTTTGLEPQKASLQDKLQAEMKQFDKAGDSTATPLPTPAVPAETGSARKRRSSVVLARYKSAQTIREQKSDPAKKAFNAEMFNRNPIFNKSSKAADMDDLGRIWMI
jgi:hypothetical protein